MAGLTNFGKQRILEHAFGVDATPLTAMYLPLITNAWTQNPDQNDATGMTQASNHPAAGTTVNFNNTDFDVSGEDDSGDWGRVQIADKGLTASGGTMTGRYVILADNATFGSITEVWAYWDLTQDEAVSDGQTLTLQNLEIRLTEA